jgi:protein ImuB
MFACIYIPDFPVEAIVRAEPLLRQHAVAVLEGKPPLVHVIALNEEARLLGMEIGMTKLQATVFAAPEENVALPGKSTQARRNRKTTQKIVFLQRRMSRAKPRPAVLRQRSPEQEISAHSALLDIAHVFTPRVEDTTRDTLLLDLGGLERLHGTPAKMARELGSRVSAVGLEANIAIAANPDTALHAARGFSGITVIPVGQEGQRLGGLPLSVLLDAFEITSEKKSAADREREKWRQQMLDTLECWGVRDFRTLALLPDHALASRLGEAGALLQRLARGAGRRTLALCESPSHFEEAMELESTVETLEPLLFVLHRLLEQLCTRLEARALAAQELHLRLQLERRVADEETIPANELDGASPQGRPAIFERTLRLPVAMRDAKVFLKLLQLELTAHPPGAPVAKLSITAEPAPPRSAQHGLFLSLTPEAEKLEITLARINSVVGERRAGIAQLLDTHRRDSLRMERFVAAQPAVTSTTSDCAAQLRLALRIVRPACQLRVRLSVGRPVYLTAMTKAADRAELQGKVVWSAGPWLSSGDWWAENANQPSAKDQASGWDREEWDVAIADGNGSSVALYRIYRDLTSGHWFADASYD